MINNNFEHLIDLNNLSLEKIGKIVDTAIDIYNNPTIYKGAASGKVLATLFYEPSTRTQMSFQTAMLRLGGSTIGFDNPSNSSVVKGENLTDTIKIVSGYADVLVMRHPKEGSALAGALYSDCPIVNAGDGTHLHPTQTLTDLVTLKSEINRLENLTVGICGDLKNGRTVHSLIKALSCYKNNKFILISTPELRLPLYIKDILNSSNCSFEEYTSIEEAISKLDVLYMTRIQKERFKSEEEYNAQKDVYILNPKKLLLAKKELKIMHPLPRVDEIDMEVDKDDRAIYFKQANYGVYARMALIIYLLSNGATSNLIKGEKTSIKCRNENCITNTECYLQNYNKTKCEIYTCEYCDDKQLL